MSNLQALLIVTADGGDSRKTPLLFMVGSRLCILVGHADLHFHTSVGYMYAIQLLYISYMLASWLWLGRYSSVR